MFTLVMDKRAKKDAEKLDQWVWENILREEVYALSFDFMKGKRLDGVFEGCRSKRVGQYRILYRVLFDEETVEMIGIDNRKEIHRKR